MKHGICQASHSRLYTARPGERDSAETNVPQTQTETETHQKTIFLLWPTMRRAVLSRQRSKSNELNTNRVAVFRSCVLVPRVFCEYTMTHASYHTPSSLVRSVSGPALRSRVELLVYVTGNLRIYRTVVRRVFAATVTWRHASASAILRLRLGTDGRCACVL